MTVEQRLYELCTELQSISGKNDKIDFIKKNKDDKDFLKYLSVLLNKLVVFGIQTKKLDKLAKKDLSDINGVELLFKHHIVSIDDMFSYLQSNNTGRDEDAVLAIKYINSLPEELQTWASASITKTLKLGVTAKSVNKALGYNLIVEFNVQRGKSYSDEAHKFKDEDKLISEKFNGIRGILEVVNGVPTFKSRQNQIFEGLKDLTTDVINKQFADGIYEGELIVKNRHQYKLREVLQETMKILASDDDDKKLDWILFDHLTHEEFAEPEISRGYFQRKYELLGLQLETENISLAPTLYIGKDDSKIYSLLDEVLERGGEGLMANLDRPYKKDKTNHILKVKKKYTSDLRVVGFEEGKSTGKHKGTLGAFLLEYKGNVVKCGVMPDSVRHDAWNNQEKYLNTIIEIEHEQESGNQNNDLLSLEYPVYISHRTDKDEPSYAH